MKAVTFVLLASSLCTIPDALQAAEHWQLQYFYDQNKSTLVISDLHFPSATRGLAVGTVVKGKQRRYVSILTSDGGAHWQLADLKEQPISLFFLSENKGFMVTDRGLWETTEAGKSWRKIPGLPSNIIRVHFTDERHGIAVGAKKRVDLTEDGGLHWKPLAAAAELPGEEKFSVYNWIAFVTPQVGMISGWNQPPRRDAPLFPEWMSPVEAMSQRQKSHLMYSLLTNDGGKTWVPNSSFDLGEVSRIRFGTAGQGLGLIKYSNAFPFPSEAYKIDWKSGKSTSIFRDRKFAINDVWLTSDGTAYLSGVVVAGELRNVVPGKVQVLKSNDLSKWSEISVDYRVSAIRTTLAVVDAEHMWMATDNGMILKLEK